MSNNNPSPSSIDSTNFLRTKNSLITYYQNMCSAQAVRLIGFSAGLFTLLGAIQLSSEEHLRVFFKNIPSLINFGLTPEGLAIINFIFVFISIAILTFFICRAIFRANAFSIIANDIIYISKDDVKKFKSKLEQEGKAVPKSLHSQINDTMVNRVTELNPKTLYIRCIEIGCFFSHGNNKKLKKGLIISCIFSFLVTCLLLLLIW